MTDKQPVSESRPSISAVLIVKNESDKLKACLESLRWADECLVLDSGSEDGSRELAKAHGARVETRSDWQGFGEQRRRAEALARCDWVFMVDADERVTPRLRDSILAAIRGGPAIWEVNRLPQFLGRDIHHSGLHPDWVPRLYPRGRAAYDQTRVHEKLRNPQGLPVRRLEGLLLHPSLDDVGHQMRKSAHYAEEWARERAALGRRANLVQALGHAGFCFVRMYLFRGGFLDGAQGLLLALLQSQATFAKYAQLWALNRIAQNAEASGSGYD